MTYARGEKFYEGKAKSLFNVVSHPELIWIEYKDSLTAFNAQKKGGFAAKGKLNRSISDAIFQHLEEKAVSTHMMQTVDDVTIVVQRLQMIAVEVVVRNAVAGSLAKKFNKEEGTALTEPLVEFYYKDDALGDPFISDEQALWLRVATAEELHELKRQALQINHHLRDYFAKISIQLVDFKLEFGKDNEGSIILADEISPDSCRLWDSKTGEKMDKDRFRRDLGQVAESYEEVWHRIQEAYRKTGL